MVKHVVMWQLEEHAAGNNKSTNVGMISKQLEELIDVVQAIDTLQVGTNFNTSDAAFDLVLITTHENKEALSSYISHPEHQKVAAFIGSLVKARTVVDFEY